MTKLHIFDVDGTILDSMRMWDDITCMYLRELGIEPEPDLAKKIDAMTVPETTAYIAERYQIEGGSETVDKGLRDLLIDQYSNKLKLFDGMLEELEEVKALGQPMIVFSNTPHCYLDLGLAKNGITDFFDEILTVEDIGFRKDLPEAFAKVCERWNMDPADVLVYEDSPFAIDAAKSIGCSVKEYDRYR